MPCSAVMQRVWSSRWLPPTIAMIISQGYAWLVAVAAGVAPFALGPGLKWDALRYLDIADHGYELHRCATGEFIPYPHPAPDPWCGNAHWFPLYPLLIRGLSGLGVAAPVAGYVLAQAATFALFVLVWRLLTSAAQEQAVAVQCLALTALLPGSTYFHLVFPTSLAALTVVGAYAALRTRSWQWAGACAAVGAAGYPSTMLLTVLAPVAILLGWRHESLTRRLGHAALVAALGAAGCAAVVGTFAVTTGHWDAYLLINRNYATGAGTLTALSKTFWDGVSFELLASWVAAAAIAVAAIAYGVRAARRHGVGLGAEGWFAITSTVCWLLLPLVSGPGLSPYRSFALMVPAALILRDAPERVRLVLLTLSGVATGLLTWAYFAGVAI